MVPAQHPDSLARCDVCSGAVLDQSLTGALRNPSSGVPLRIQPCCEIHTYMKSDMVRKKKKQATRHLLVPLCFQQTKPPSLSGEIGRMLKICLTRSQPNSSGQWWMVSISVYSPPNAFPLALLSVRSQAQVSNSTVPVVYLHSCHISCFILTTWCLPSSAH